MNRILFFLFFVSAKYVGFSQQNIWVQKASVGFSGKSRAVSFSIGSKIYIGTGSNANTSTGFTNDFWEYDTLTNIWTQKANFAGAARFGALGFSIGSKGYIGTGGTGNGTSQNDFWEYNPSTNSWLQRANMPIISRSYGIGMSINGRGFAGTGYSGNGIFLNDFWEYIPSNNTWVQRASVGPSGRQNAVAFKIGNKGYLGTGDNMLNGSNLNAIFVDFWEYNPLNDTWIQKQDFPGGSRKDAFGFSVNGKGYIGGGYSGVGGGTLPKDLWEYDTLLNNWRKRADISISRMNSVGATGGYMGTGKNIVSLGGTTGTSVYLNDFYQYKPCNGMLIGNLTIDICQNQSYTFNGQNLTTSGVYYDTLYASTGCDSLVVLNLTVRANPVLSIVANGSTSICSGDSVQLNVQTAEVGLNYQWQNNNVNIFGETNSNYYANTAGTYKLRATNTYNCSTTTNGISVIVNPLPNSIVTPSGNIQICIGSSVNLSANMGSGLSYQWKLNGNNIIGATNPNYIANQDGIYTVLITNSNGCNKLSNSTTVVSNPIPTTPTISTSGATTICLGNTTSLISSATLGNQWYLNGNLLAGATSNTLTVSAAGIYSVINTINGCSSSQSNSIQVVVNSIPTPTINSSGPTTFCQGGEVSLNSLTTTGVQWYINGVPISFANNPTYLASTSGSYSIAITDNGCTSNLSNSIVVNVIQPPPTPTIVWNGTQFTTAATGVTYQWLLNGNPITGATSANYTPTAIGTYSLQVAANGCSSTSDSYTLVVTSVDPTLTLSNSCEVYPNPAQNDFVIKLFEAPEKTVDIVMINSVGKVVKTFKVKNKLNVIKTNGLSSGVYYLKISGDKFNEVKKLEIIK